MAKKGVRGTARLSLWGKHEVAKSMFEKGVAFFHTYQLLQKEDLSEPAEWVSLHNLCQGVEVTLKSLLLFSDFDKYRPMLKDAFGHDLGRLFDGAILEYKLHGLSNSSKQEIAELSKFYRCNTMRYGTGMDFFIIPNGVKRERVVRLMAQIIKSTIRKLEQAGEAKFMRA
jgi:hypothetical protein